MCVYAAGIRRAHHTSNRAAAEDAAWASYQLNSRRGSLAARGAIGHTWLVSKQARVIIDGNNLLHAMHRHAPVAHVGRETLVRVVDRWARACDSSVRIVFDGPKPRDGLAKQMATGRVTVSYSVSESADDVIVRVVQGSGRPFELRVITSDKAIASVARRRKCDVCDSESFVGEMFSSFGGGSDRSVQKPRRTGEGKPSVAPVGTDEWIELFGLGDEDDPFDGFDAMADE
jgi:predicted RNA-binding protein with PIN domain